MTIAEKIVKLNEDADKLIDLNNQLEQALYGTDVGGKSYYDEFWDAFQNYGKRTDYPMAFRGTAFEYIHPKHKIEPTTNTSAQNTFYNANKLKKIEAKYFDFSKKPRGTYQTAGWYYTFGTCGNLEEIEDIGIGPDYELTYTFAYCNKLKKIAKIGIDANTKITSPFAKCIALESITFDGEIGQNIGLKDSTLLTKESITNIINHLSNTVSGKTLTLSVTAVKNAFGGGTWDSDGDGKADTVMGSEEWVDLQKTKPNWTITLV